MEESIQRLYARIEANATHIHRPTANAILIKLRVLYEMELEETQDVDIGV